MKPATFLSILQSSTRCRLASVATAAGPLVAMLALTTAVAAQSLVWVPQGPAPTAEGQVERIEGGHVAGAINAAALHPTDPDIIYVASVNGGIWKTANATATSPRWQPLSDGEKSMSIGALAFDPTDRSHQTLVAGTRRFSSMGFDGGDLIGLLRTTNGGSSWTNIDGGVLKQVAITGVAPRGNVIVVSSLQGLFRGSNTNTGWVKISGRQGTGLPDGPAFDLASDPDNPARLFTNGGGRGIYRSVNAGATWSKVSNAAMDALLGNRVENVKISLGAGNSVYVAIAVDVSDRVRRLAGLFRSGDGGNSWTALDLPLTLEARAEPFGVHPGGQANWHSSLAADRSNPNIVYIGGDRQPGYGESFHTGSSYFPNSIGAATYSGRLFRIDASRPAGRQAAHITHSNTASFSAPHADSRGMYMAVNGDLIEVDDGGIYRRTRPLTNTGDWVSMNGNIQIGELHSVAWDANARVIVAGAQDTGTPQQARTSDTNWNSVTLADGGVVAVDDFNPGFSVRYSSEQRLARFRRQVYDAKNAFQSEEAIRPRLLGGGAVAPQWQFYTPLALNGVAPDRLILGSEDRFDRNKIILRAAVYESDDQGTTIEEIGPGIEINQTGPIAYGAAGNPDILYIGSGAKVFIRTGPRPAPLRASASYPGKGTVLAIAIHPKNPRIAYVVESSNVYRTRDAGATWERLTGNLGPLGSGVLRTVAVRTGGAGDAVLVGANTGVFIASAPGFSNWSRLGSGLPNVPALRLQYSAKDQVLLAGTLGRGAWTLDFKGRP